MHKSGYGLPNLIYEKFRAVFFLAQVVAYNSSPKGESFFFAQLANINHPYVSKGLLWLTTEKSSRTEKNKTKFYSSWGKVR